VKRVLTILAQIAWLSKVVVLEERATATTLPLLGGLSFRSGLSTVAGWCA
jgi:hypothetical protein